VEALSLLTGNIDKAKRLHREASRLNHIWSKAYSKWEKFTHEQLSETESKEFWQWYWEVGYKL
jgi:hypothetical protein